MIGLTMHHFPPLAPQPPSPKPQRLTLTLGVLPIGELSVLSLLAVVVLAA